MSLMAQVPQIMINDNGTVFSRYGRADVYMNIPDASKPVQTTLWNQPTCLSNQRHLENSMSLQVTLGFFSSRSGIVAHSAYSPLILCPLAIYNES